MKKILIYIAILVVGLVLGKLFFGNSGSEVLHRHTENQKENKLWTCSMHPQIMQPEFGDCPICGMDLIPADTSVNGLSAAEFTLTENAMALADIQTSVVEEKKGGETSVKLSGKIMENEEAHTVAASHFSGRIEKLYIDFTGEKVRKGQLLASVYSPELFAAQQELLTAVHLKETQPALYKAVRNKLKLWKLSEKQINTIETSGKLKENFSVYASVSGTVSEKLVAEGDYVKSGQALLKIVDLNSVWAVFDVYENQIGLFKKGQSMRITTHTFTDKIFKAKVSFIDPILDVKSRTVKIRAVLDNSKGQLKPGMFIESEIKVSETADKEVLTIPATAVLWTGERSVVYVKTSPTEPVFKMREVRLGKSLGDSFVVLEGLNAGDEIVTNGTFTVDAAAQLQGKKSMMNRGTTTMNTDKKEPPKMINKPSDKRMEVSPNFQKQLKKLFDEYIVLKNALVKDDAKTFQKAAKKMGEKWEEIDTKGLSKEIRNKWTSLEKEMKHLIEKIAETSDLKQQRGEFETLSLQFTRVVRLFGVGQKVYRQFCPMAGNKGAYWLSEEEVVFNPYYGDAMLRCGRVTETIE